MTATASPAATSTAVDGFLADVQRGSISPHHYTPQAMLDAVVPGWRFAAEGPDAIVSDHVWCGGRWPADLLAEMERARHAR